MLPFTFVSFGRVFPNSGLGPHSKMQTDYIMPGPQGNPTGLLCSLRARTPTRRLTMGQGSRWQPQPPLAWRPQLQQGCPQWSPLHTTLPGVRGARTPLERPRSQMEGHCLGASVTTGGDRRLCQPIGHCLVVPLSTFSNARARLHQDKTCPQKNLSPSPGNHRCPFKKPTLPKVLPTSAGKGGQGPA